ncbi:MAG: heavy metal-binding domain-containing protein [Nitrospira sp.]|nr:heavy metal-binding domain-containing protein [bacterium]MBL7048216.1 heavy metal-binding domain-containing protein [Nitrospira sp.]
MTDYINIIVFFILISCGYFFGKHAEKNHYASINKREKKMLKIPTTNSRHPIGEIPDVMKSRLVHGNVVISVDYFKRILAGLRNFFGGPVRSYETLVDRARREAILRMKESCPGAGQIINLRIETSSISQGGKNTIGSIEVLAYGTAIFFYPEN